MNCVYPVIEFQFCGRQSSAQIIEHNKMKNTYRLNVTVADASSFAVLILQEFVFNVQVQRDYEIEELSSTQAGGTTRFVYECRLANSDSLNDLVQRLVQFSKQREPKTSETAVEATYETTMTLGGNKFAIRAAKTQQTSKVFKFVIKLQMNEGKENDNAKTRKAFDGFCGALNEQLEPTEIRRSYANPDCLLSDIFTEKNLDVSIVDAVVKSYVERCKQLNAPPALLRPLPQKTDTNCQSYLTIIQGTTTNVYDILENADIDFICKKRKRTKIFNVSGDKELVENIQKKIE